MGLDRFFIEESLQALEENLRFLRELSTREREDFKNSKQSCYSAAYALMIAIEAISGIASHLIGAQKFPSPTGMAHSFEILREHGILGSDQLVEQLKAMSRFRNLIVHRYWQVNYGQVYDILRLHLDDFARFSEDVQAFLDTLD